MNVNLACDNAVTFWSMLALARGYQVRSRPGFIAIIGTDRYGMRVMVRSPDLTTDERAEIGELVGVDRPGPVTVEDPFNTVQVDRLTPRQLPVMIRQPAPAPTPSLPVELVRTEDDLAVAERIVVEGFALDNFQPYRRGEAFPARLLGAGAVDLYLVHRDGQPAGASLTVPDDRVVGAYWVTTMPGHRSRGVGRALMLAALARYTDRPMTLTASRAGRPLYDSLGFTKIVDSTWWSR